MLIYKPYLSAAQHGIPFVEHGSLAGGHRPLGGVEDQQHPAVPGDRLRRGLPVAVADLGAAPDGPLRLLPGAPAEIRDPDLPRVQSAFQILWACFSPREPPSTVKSWAKA